MFQNIKRFYIVNLLMFLVSLSFLACIQGCASVPHISQLPSQETSKIQKDCRKIFPQGKWRFVHSIQVNIAGKKRTNLIGITQVDSESRSLQSVLMTIEGMVVFEAKYDKQDIKIKKSTPPFDSPHFAKGLIQDVKFIFLLPSGECIDAGLSENDEYICRYKKDSSHTKDIEVSKNKRQYTVNLYNKGKKIRTLSAIYRNSTQKSSPYSPPQRLQLKSYSPSNNYSLKMNLIKTNRINPL